MKLKLYTTMLVLSLALAGCNRDLSPLNSAFTSWQPTPTANPCLVVADPYMWFDFETDPSSFWWGPPLGPTSLIQTWTNSMAATGCRSWKLQTGAGVGYGHWPGLTMATSPAIPAGSTKLEISIMININLTTTLSINEGTSAGGQGQEWSHAVTFVNSPGFVTYTYPLSGFTTSDPGDAMVNTQDVIQIWFYHSAPYASHALYIDNIRFIP